MKRRTSFSLILFVLLFVSPADARTVSGRVLKVFDGDTFLVRVQGKEEHVRLREIDAPEIGRRKSPGQEPWGRRSRDYAAVLVRGRNVRLEIEDADERDKYQRLLAYVFVEQRLVNLEMIRSGNAFFYPAYFRGRYSGELEKTEARAREKGTGVFDQRKGLKETPQEFRARTNRDEGFFSRVVRLIRGKEKKSPPANDPPPPEKIVGNKRSMIYHLPGSSGAARVSVKNRVLFDSSAEAEKAGFRRARNEEAAR